MIFDRVVCGVDGTDESLEAALQAARLCAGRLTLVTVLDPWDQVIHISRPTDAERRLDPREAAEVVLQRAAAEVSGMCEATQRLLQGSPLQQLLDEADRTRATMIAVGPHGPRHVARPGYGVVSGLVHYAPCSVLIARPTARHDDFPSAAVVGVDGSPESAFALQVAGELYGSYGTDVRAVCASDGADCEAATELATAYALEIVDGHPVGALVEAGADADLVIVGSRRLHGVRAFASVAERVAHRAPCSVLVAWTPTAAAREGHGEEATVEDVMSEPAPVAAEDATLEELTRVMLEHDVGAVAIVAADGKLTGLVSASHVAGRQVERFAGWDPKATPTMLLGHWLVPMDQEALARVARTARARDVMTCPVPVAVAGEPAHRAVERMARRRIAYLPVVRDGVPVGMITHHDLLEHAVQRWRRLDHRADFDE